MDALIAFLLQEREEEQVSQMVMTTTTRAIAERNDSTTGAVLTFQDGLQAAVSGQFRTEHAANKQQR
ncbi:hypothetical protein Vi05172_g5789 [Venturia inaequalis]|nr:hypothetical protein Vi05172_g5789 [Venturia inaequalis]